MGKSHPALAFYRWILAPAAALIVLVAITIASSAQQAGQYPPLSAYLMPKEAEIALAKSAAPANILGRATIKVLSESGFEIASECDNDFVCMVMRGWSAPTYTPAEFRELIYEPTVRAPICFDPVAAESVLPYYELRSRLAMKGQSPDEIAERVEAAYAQGVLPQREAVSFAYMWSADQNLIPGVGAWHPHVMVFAPYYDNATIGGNEFGSALPQLTDDAGTPFSVVVIPVDLDLAIESAATP